jgi:hypothetical protein
MPDTSNLVMSTSLGCSSSPLPDLCVALLGTKGLRPAARCRHPKRVNRSLDKLLGDESG